MSHDIAAALQRLAPRLAPGATSVGGLRRLSGGASQETWAFAVEAPGGTVPLILRRTPGGIGRAPGSAGVPLALEVAAIRAAASAGVPVPGVVHLAEPADGLGEAYVMAHVPGETIARKILRDDAFAQLRTRLARECGGILARLHGVAPEAVAALPVADGPTQLAQYRAVYDGFDDPRPVFELAFAWLAERLRTPSRVSLVHGDFRLGNLMVTPDSVAAVLDWELTHVGDPAEDLGWICVNAWRFGSSQPVGGFGSVEDLLAGYREAGGAAVTADDVKLWEVFGTLKWGIMCMTMVAAWRQGIDTSVERAAIGRRASETEIDLLNLLA